MVTTGSVGMSRQILQSKAGSRENRPELLRGKKFPEDVRCMPPLPLPPDDEGDEADEADAAASNPTGLEAPVAATLDEESCDMRNEGFREGECLGASHG